MQIRIKYPKKKFLEINDVNDLKKQLTELMIVSFDIKKISERPYKTVKENIYTLKLTENDIETLTNTQHAIVPIEITQCEIH